MNGEKTEQVEPQCGWKQYLMSAVKITMARSYKGYRCLGGGGGEGGGMLKLFEALATKPGISHIHLVPHYQTLAFLGFCAAHTHHHLTHADLSTYFMLS